MKDDNLIELTLQIDGMHCPMCEDHVNNKIRRVKGVRKVSSSHRKNQATVIIEEGTSVEEVANAVTSQGYRLLHSETKPYVKKGFFASLFKKS